MALSLQALLPMDLVAVIDIAHAKLQEWNAESSNPAQVLAIHQSKSPLPTCSIGAATQHVKAYDSPRCRVLGAASASPTIPLPTRSTIFPLPWLTLSTPVPLPTSRTAQIALIAPKECPRPTRSLRLPMPTSQLDKADLICSGQLFSTQSGWRGIVSGCRWSLPREVFLCCFVVPLLHPLPFAPFLRACFLLARLLLLVLVPFVTSVPCFPTFCHTFSQPGRIHIL
ncbi:hypothetical protein BCR44DRAFT_1193574 [Catenaria anguillulae PL171]|uniref:Uncharacterized protein n=1 Tax=Catenaria anguillulae PL171 TaxID=765915 RepID=A0A1Y2HG58_9FUNG|nr:hypothetical protein BCR44DRAFT_1193574 [Catenaria anguillulae PL171]